MKRFDDIENITKEELYALFVETVMASSDARLKDFPESGVIEERKDVDVNGNIVVEEVEAGKAKLIYAYTERGYLTYVVSFVNTEIMNVYNVETSIVVAEFHRNEKQQSWSNINSVESDVTISMTEIINEVALRLRKLLL